MTESDKTNERGVVKLRLREIEDAEAEDAIDDYSDGEDAEADSYLDEDPYDPDEACDPSKMDES